MKYNKRKADIITSIISALLELAAKENNLSPSQRRVAEYIVDKNLLDTAEPAYRKVTEDQWMESIGRGNYWKEAVLLAGDAMGCRHHMVTSEWYAKQKPLPKSFADAKKFIAIFANGRNRKTAGVRFVPPGQVDVLYSCATKIDGNIKNSGNKIYMENLKKALADSIVTEETHKTLPFPFLPQSNPPPYDVP